MLCTDTKGFSFTWKCHKDITKAARKKKLISIMLRTFVAPGILRRQVAEVLSQNSSKWLYVTSAAERFVTNNTITACNHAVLKAYDQRCVKRSRKRN